MHTDSGAAGRGSITISFTALLYGVVIDVTLHRIHSLSFSPSNVLLVIAVLLVIQDFFFYHEDMKSFNFRFLLRERKITGTRAPNGGDERKRAEWKEFQRKKLGIERKIFLFDTLVLVAWFALSLAAAFSTLPAYLACLALFFLAINFWDWMITPLESELNEGPKLSFFSCVRSSLFCRRPTLLHVTLFTGAAAAAAALGGDAVRAETGEHGSFAEWSPLAVALLVLPLLVFLGWRRFYYWPTLAGVLERDLEAASLRPQTTGAGGEPAPAIPPGSSVVLPGGVGTG